MNDDGEKFGKMEMRGNKNPAGHEPCGTRIFKFLSVNLFCLQQKGYFLFEVLAWELCSIKYVLKIWNI